MGTSRTQALFLWTEGEESAQSAQLLRFPQSSPCVLLGAQSLFIGMQMQVCLFFLPAYLLRS